MSNNDNSPPVGQNARFAAPAVAPSGKSRHPPGGAEAGDPVPIAGRGKFMPSRRRPWWKWLLIGLLLAFSLAVTVMYAATLATDISRHHWAAALDASRDAVPAIVGWAALAIVFGTGGAAASERLLPTDDLAARQERERVSRDTDSVLSAQQRVAKLTARLAELATTHNETGSAPPAGLDRRMAETTARLDQARQWLASARAALAASRQRLTDAEDKLADVPTAGWGYLSPAPPAGFPRQHPPPPAP